MNHRRRRVYMSDLVIACIVVAILFGTAGFILGHKFSGKDMSLGSSSSETHNTHHYSCSACGYSFDDLSTLRVERIQIHHFYYCPGCGELLTSDVNGNAIENMTAIDENKDKVKDNWNN